MSAAIARAFDAVGMVNGAMLIDLARQKFGEPSRKSSADYRFFDNLKLSINPIKKTWHDHSSNEGGGVLDFIVYLGLAVDKRHAAQWIESQCAGCNYDCT